MSLLGSIGNFLKNPIQPITHAIGKTVGVTANLNNGVHIDPAKLAMTAGALALPGVGSLVGKGLGELGGALGAIPGVGTVEGALGSAGSAINSIPGVSSIENLLKSGGSKVAGLLTGGNSSGAPGQGSGGLLSSIEGLLTGNGGLNALGIAQGINAASLGKQSSDYAKDALGSATGAYNDKAPLRTAGQAGLLNPQTQDLSGLRSIASLLGQAPAGGNLATIAGRNAFAQKPPSVTALPPGVVG